MVNNTLLYNRLPAVFLQKWLAHAIHLEGSLHLDHHDRFEDDGDDHGAHDGQDGEVVGLLEPALLFTRYTPCRPSR